MAKWSKEEKSLNLQGPIVLYYAAIINLVPFVGDMCYLGYGWYRDSSQSQHFPSNDTYHDDLRLCKHDIRIRFEHSLILLLQSYT